MLNMSNWIQLAFGQVINASIFDIETETLLNLDLPQVKNLLAQQHWEECDKLMDEATQNGFVYFIRVHDEEPVPV